jgi:hypothetical protein
MIKALTFEKLAGRKLVLQNATSDAEYALQRVLTEGRVSSGWRAALTVVKEEDVDVKVETGKVNEDGTPEVKTKNSRYTFELHVQQKSKRLRREDIIAKEFEKIVALAGKALNSRHWTLVSVGDLPEDYVLPGYENVDAVEVEEKPKAKKAKKVKAEGDEAVPESVPEVEVQVDLPVEAESVAEQPVVE